MLLYIANCLLTKECLTEIDKKALMWSKVQAKNRGQNARQIKLSMNPLDSIVTYKKLYTTDEKSEYVVELEKKITDLENENMKLRSEQNIIQEFETEKISGINTNKYSDVWVKLWL